MRLTPNPLDLPGPRRFWRSFIGEIDHVSSLVLVCPDRASADAVAGIARSYRPLLRRALVFTEVEQLVRHPPSEILDLLGGPAPPGTAVDARGLVDHHAGMGRLLWVDATDAGPDAMRDWFKFLVRFEEAGKTQPSEYRLVIVTVLTGIALGERPPGIALRWWWGVLGRLDAATYIEETYEVAPAVVMAAVEIAKFDLDLVDALLGTARPAWHGDARVLRDVLCDYAKVRQFASTGLCEAPVVRGDSRDAPPVDLLDSWSAGVVERWNGAVEVHSAAIHFRSPVDTARLLLWQGQLGSVLPLLEARRRQVGAWVARHGDVVEKHMLRAGLKDDDGGPLEELEIGQLAYLIGKIAPLSRTDPRLTDYAHALRLARNCLAHLRPVPAFDLAELDRYGEVEASILGR